MKKRIPEGYRTERKFSARNDAIKVYDNQEGKCIGSVVLSENGRELTPYEMVKGICQVVEEYRSEKYAEGRI